MKLPDMAAIFTGKASYADAIADVAPTALRGLTDEVFDDIEEIVAGARDADVVFVARDTELENPEQGWTIGHVVAHLTAGLEEAAAGASALARGVAFDGRLRFETPWETIQTAAQVRDRLAESRRMCRAFLATWPDKPALDLTVTPVPVLGPINALGRYMLGVFHAAGHRDQVREIMRQARE